MNRLAAEQSPYLLQHKDNPVEWYPWGEAAFEHARAEDRPIFLSVGYSTCHWCHVMAHESFESPEIAARLNRDFVAIKVDREERPDVDRVYMTFVQATTGSGGWPMSVWLTPSLEPFYGGTYFPPTSRWGRPGFVDVMAEVARVWREERSRVEQSAATILARLRDGVREASTPPTAASDDAAVLGAAVRAFGAAFDARHGGFGRAPKFPRPSELLFLLREHARTGDPHARDMALATLRAMALGGMRDHLGGGFHRYSVDAEWRVPHFEKMLYDQAQLALAFLEAAQVTSDPFYGGIAAETLRYVARDLRSPEGGFRSAEDADSLDPEEAGRPGAHGREGAFYVWRDEEIGRLLGADADVFRLRYGVLPDGNAPADPQGEFAGRNLLYAARSVEDVASLTGGATDDVSRALARAAGVLLEARLARPRPYLDDKVLTAWNGLAIAAFARASRVLDEGAQDWRDAAVRAADFLAAHVWRADDGLLLRRYRAGEAAIEGYAEDHACLVFGVLELFQATGHTRWLDWALALQRRQDALFGDEQAGGWFSTTGRDDSVLLRLKEDHDGAEPAASSVSILNLLSLAQLTADRSLADRAERALAWARPRVAAMPRAMPMAAAALSTFAAGSVQIVIAGPGDRRDTAALMERVRGVYLPAAVVVPVDPEAAGDRPSEVSWLADMTMRDGRATAYVCRNFVCQAPTTDPAELERVLRQAAGS
ncbi:MAG: thioredoxin domain-containing protein [Acidimicrobiia bacterium]|nr:thioredoxin domain-containing protein [Acidimicrobiia bacterium]